MLLVWNSWVLCNKWPKRSCGALKLPVVQGNKGPEGECTSTHSAEQVPESHFHTPAGPHTECSKHSTVGSIRIGYHTNNIRCPKYTLARIRVNFRRFREVFLECKDSEQRLSRTSLPLKKEGSARRAHRGPAAEAGGLCNRLCRFGFHEVLGVQPW